MEQENTVQLTREESLSNAEKAKQIMFETLDLFVEDIRKTGGAFTIKEEDRTISFEADAAKTLLSQMKKELDVFEESQPFCYLKWSFLIPRKESVDKQGASYDLSKLIAIEMIINHCFGKICEGTFQPTQYNVQEVRGAIYIYPEAVKQIMNNHSKLFIPIAEGSNRTQVESDHFAPPANRRFF